MPYDLHGKTVVVTGATSGIGLATVRKMAGAGAFVIGVGRSQERSAAALAHVLADVPGGRVQYVLADLSSQAQVWQLAEDVRAALDAQGFTALDALVNNAGVYLEKKTMTVDGIEQTFAVNHLAGFLLTHALLPWLGRSYAGGRVLTVSSYAHKTTWLSLNRIADPWPYFGLLAYKRSKLCNVLFTMELNQRFPEIKAVVVDPGLVNTGIASKGGAGVSAWVWRRRRHQGMSADIPAETFLRLVSDPALDIGQGTYFQGGKPALPSRNARNERLAARLWDLSTRLTGVEKG